MRKIEEQVFVPAGPFCLHCIISDILVAIQKHRGAMDQDEMLAALAKVAGDVLASAPLEGAEVLAAMKRHNTAMVHQYCEHRRAGEVKPRGTA